MELWLFIIVWIFIFVVLVSFLPAILYILSLVFNWFKPEKKTKKDTNYSLSQIKEIKGRIE